MGRILNGILGPVKGKVGPVVGASCFGIDYLKSFVPPSNPNTASQQTQRNKFTSCQALAKAVLATLIYMFWNPFASGKSGYNAFMSEMLLSVDASHDLQVTSRVTIGSLEPASGVTVTYATATGATIFTWDEDVYGNGLLTDYVGVIVYDKTTQVFRGYTTGTTTRDDETKTVTLATGLTATNLMGFLWFYRGTGSTFVVSDSVADVAAAP